MLWLISQSHFSLISLPKFPHNNSLERTKLNAPETSLEIQTGPEEFIDQIPTHGLKSSCRLLRTRRCMDVKDAREREKILQAVGTDII
jgi:hypothetical protein